MIILIDNYDSFSYNLYQLIGTVNPDIKVIRNDEMSVKEIEELKPSHIILSPGPGKPSDAGICEDVVLYFKEKVSILGVCLGHQAICEAFGAVISHAKRLMHGKKSVIKLDTSCELFKGIEESAGVARYHSLAVKHRNYDIYGVQFHPESIMTKTGTMMIENFLSI